MSTESPSSHCCHSINYHDNVNLIYIFTATALHYQHFTVKFRTSTAPSFSSSRWGSQYCDTLYYAALTLQDVDQLIFGGLLSEPPKVTDSFCGKIYRELSNQFLQLKKSFFWLSRTIFMIINFYFSRIKRKLMNVSSAEVLDVDFKKRPG